MMIGKKTASRIFASDKTIIMIGAKGAGKTNFASVLMETLVSLGYHVWTNIHFFQYEEIDEAISKNKLLKDIHYRKKPDEVHVVSSLSDLLKGLVGEGKKVVFLDEAGIHASSSQPMAKTTVAIKQLAYIIRHFDSCLVLIAQTDGSIPPDLREKLVDYKIKVMRAKRSVTFGERDVIEDEFGNEHINFPVTNGFEHTSHSIYPFDSNCPTGFDIDINIKDALTELSKLGSSLNVMKDGAKLLEKFKKTKKTGDKRPSKKDLIFREFEMENDDLRSISNKYKTSYPYVCNLHSMWENDN